MVYLQNLNNEKLVVISYDIWLCQCCIVKTSTHFKNMTLIKLRKVMIYWNILHIFSHNNVLNYWLLNLRQPVNLFLWSFWKRLLSACIQSISFIIQIYYIIDLKSWLRFWLWLHFILSTFSSLLVFLLQLYQLFIIIL